MKMIIQKNLFSHGLMHVPISYIIAVPIAAIFGVSIHFILVHAKSFDHDHAIHRTYPRFIAITLANIATGTFFVYSLVTFVLLDVIPARIISAIVLGIVAYLIHKFFTFV